MVQKYCTGFGIILVESKIDKGIKMSARLGKRVKVS